METVPKAPQEIAAQMMDVYPYYSDIVMPPEHAQHLDTVAKGMRAEVEGMKPFMLPDDELAPKLADIQNRAKDSGVWRADKGEGVTERLDYAVHVQKQWGYSDEEARTAALRELRRNGYLDAIRLKRKEQEQAFLEPLTNYIKSHNLDTASEREQIDALLERTIDITTLGQAEPAKLLTEFQSGNFLYHGTGTEQLVQILDTGVLASVKALKQREYQAAEKEGREVGIIRHNSGYEGVSWSMNCIDALPGDRYHLAGFVAAPETVLGEGGQLAVPSQPAPNEVILLDGGIDANKYYATKTQLELYEAYARNSVLGGLIRLVAKKGADEPNELVDILPRLKEDEGFTKLLRDGYSVTEQGTITLSPDLLSSSDEATETPVAAVWLQALVDTGRLKGTMFEGLSTAETISSITDKNIEQLYIELRKDVAVYEENSCDEVGMVGVPVEKMHFVAPRKDAAVWLKVMARSRHKPAGILLYDDKKVRLENFASLHRGDNAELTNELQTAIPPDNEDYINYARILGTEFTDDMRTGHKLQVIAEKYLANRKSIKLVNGKLVLE